MNKPSTSKTYQGIINHSFQRFRLGLALFFVGFVILYGVDQLLEPSLYQEVVAAIALITITVGLCVALVAEVVFVLYRVVAFFSSDNSPDR